MTVRVMGMALVAIGVLAAYSRAEARPTARLVYVRGEGAATCPDEEILRQSVAARLGYDPFRPLVQHTLFAEVHREKRGFVGSVKMVDEGGLERGARSLEEFGDDCSEIMAAMALSMSIAIDPRSALAPLPPTLASEPTAAASEPESHADAAAPAPETPDSNARPAPSPPPRRIGTKARLGVGLGVHGAVGVAPATTAGARISGEVAWPNVSAGLEVRADLPASSNMVEGQVVRTSLIGGALVPCLKLAWASVCGVGFVGRLRAESLDVAAPTSKGFVFVAAGVRLATDFRIGEGFSVRIAADLLGTMTPFTLDVNTRPIYESPAVSGLAGASFLKFF